MSSPQLPPSTPPASVNGTGDVLEVTSGLEKVRLGTATVATPETAATAPATTPWSSPPRNNHRSPTTNSSSTMASTPQQQTPVRSLVFPPPSPTPHRRQQQGGSDKEDDDSLALPRTIHRTTMDSPLRNPAAAFRRHPTPPLPHTPGRGTATTTTNSTAAANTPTRHYDRTPVIRNVTNTNNDDEDEGLFLSSLADNCDHPLALPSDWAMGGGVRRRPSNNNNNNINNHASTWLPPTTTDTFDPTSNEGTTEFLSAVPLPEAGKFYTFTSRQQYEQQQQPTQAYTETVEMPSLAPTINHHFSGIQPYQPDRDDWSDCGGPIPKEELDRIFSQRPTTTITTTTAAAAGGSNMSTSTTSTSTNNHNHHEQQGLFQQQQHQPTNDNPWLFQQLQRTIPLDQRDFSIPSIKLAQELPAGEDSVTSYYSYTDDDDDDDDTQSSFLSYESNLFRNNHHHHRRNSSLLTDDGDGDNNNNNNNNNHIFYNANNADNDDDESLLTITSSYTHTTHTNTDTNITNITSVPASQELSFDQQAPLTGIGILNSMSSGGMMDETDDASSLLSNRMMMAMQDNEDDEDGSWQQQQQQAPPRDQRRRGSMPLQQNMDIMMMWNDATASGAAAGPEQPLPLMNAQQHGIPELPQVRLAARSASLSHLPQQQEFLSRPLSSSEAARRDRRHRQRANRRRGRRQRAQQRALEEQQREQGAWEWLRTVQADQNVVAEAASSRFLRQDKQQDHTAAAPYPLQKQLSAAVVETRTFCLDVAERQDQKRQFLETS